MENAFAARNARGAFQWEKTCIILAQNIVKYVGIFTRNKHFYEQKLYTTFTKKFVPVHQKKSISFFRLIDWITIQK